MVDNSIDPEVFTVARITRTGDLVVNIEVADQKWIDDHRTDPWFYFHIAPDKDGNLPVMGLHFDPKSGLFEQLPPPPKPEADEPTVKGGKKK